MNRHSLPRRELTPDEITLAHALFSSSVHYPAGSSDQRWVRSVCGGIVLKLDGATMVTELTANRLVALAIRMRRQLPPDALAIAERLLKKRSVPVPRSRRVTAGAAVALLTLAYVAGCSSCWQRPGCKAPPPAPAPKDTVTR